MIKEACVENLAEAKRAEKLGASQIELCGRLDLDGLTPAIELVSAVLSELTIHVKVMIRPRGGNFVCSQSEIDEMVRTIKQFRKLGVKEIVLGLLTEQNELDIENIKKLAMLANPMKVTFHKAIDELKDPVKGVEQLIEIPEITAVLTSGGKPTANEGATVIKQMKAAAEGKLQIIAAGKITNENLEETSLLIDADVYHGKLIVGLLH